MNTEHDDSWKRWADMVAKTIGAGWEDLIRLTEDGLEVQPIYPAHAISAYPAFTGAGWLMAQYVADDTATALLNRSMLDELEGGTNMIMFPLTVAAEMTASHMPDILDGVYTNACQFGYPHGGDAVKLAAIWAEYAKRCDDKGQSLKVHLGADPVADIMFDRFDHVEANDQATALARWQTCHQSDLPDIRCFAAAGDAYHRYGLTDAQELGLCLASLVWQWRILEESGLSPEQAISGSVMRIAVTADLYSALSKTRAARILLNQISAVMDNDKTPLLHGFTSDRMMTRIEPVNNVLRHVTASLGTALGGAELITTLPHDWLSGSTGMSRRLARNLQLIMRDEARIDQVADPAHGAHTLEAMSQSLAQKAWQIFQKIERAGGAMTVATSSLLSDWAKTASESRQADMDNRHHGMLGINHHPQQPTDPLPPLIMECGHPRGGMVRPAQPWEDMRLAAYNKGFRCLILNNGDSDKTLIARWADELRMAGIQMADIRITNAKEARTQIATAKPHLLVASHAVLSMLTDDDMEKISIPSVPLDADGKVRRQMVMAVIESDGWGV